ncbi:LacI family DNA-binding transcriptional regulator [Yinghuangia sp. YIM S09857]|uniref:LacI family DNA-binding transcriptional regulator n=1 Tax=Yinghuangia sp. YIM S09857 TaxID=3436929 RepID=UPI003F534EF8
MADVAALAGVSAQTVSRVANGAARVDPETARRVMRAMRQVGYRPNSAARTLATGRSRMLGVIGFDLSTYGNARALEAVVGAAQARGYSVNVVTAPARTRAAVTEAFGQLARHDVDGVIVFHAEALDAAPELPGGVPVVVVDGDGGSDGGTVHGVRTDHAAGAALAVEHLLSLGHRTVFHLAGPADSFPARHRSEAWMRVLAAAGRPVPPVVYGDWSAESGHRLGTRLAENPTVTAVFAANDQMALGLVRALREAGRGVPDDVSVVGFDDMPEAAYFHPPLTTIAQDFGAVGERSVRLLLDLLHQGGSDAPADGPIEPRLIVRASTAPPPADDRADR